MRSFGFNAQNALVGFPKQRIEKFGAVSLQCAAVYGALFGEFPGCSRWRSFHKHRGDDSIRTPGSRRRNFHQALLQNGS